MSEEGMTMAEVKELKEDLIHLVSAAMIKEPSFDGLKKKLKGHQSAEMKKEADALFGSSDSDSDDDGDSSEDDSSAEGEAGDVVVQMIQYVEAICPHDAEFVLKLAVYVRDDLGIRSTANFLTALCAYQQPCQPYLTVYLKAIINLPSDWLQIASFARDLPMRATFGLPASLRKALTTTFTKFNEYSLAKYNKEGAQKKKKKAEATRVAQGEGDDEGGSPAAMPYTLKQMVRMLHLSQPTYYVLCLLGKRYPSTADEFRKMGMDADGSHAFDSRKAGARMRLAIPTTWETQLASRGNTNKVWEELVKAKQLPFMAMLRNLRNIILAGCNEETHDLITRRLTSEDQVAASRQFPYRFFSAYDAIDIDLSAAYATQEELDAFKASRGRGRGGGRGGRGGRGGAVQTKPKLKPEHPPTPQLLKRYKGALDKSVQLATALNVRPIHGRTIVMCHVDSVMMMPVRAQGSKGIGSVRKVIDVALLLGLMFKYACEDCQFVLFSNKKHLIIGSGIKTGNILENMKTVLQKAEDLLKGKDEREENVEDKDKKKKKAEGGEEEEEEEESDSTQYTDEDDEDEDDGNYFPFGILDTIVDQRQSLDALIVIDHQHSLYEEGNPCMNRGHLPQYLQKIRRFVNENLLFVAVDVNCATGVSGGSHKQFNHPNDVLMTGFSDSILRFVAERGAGGPLRYIEHIDEVKNIDTSSVCLPMNVDEYQPQAISEDAISSNESEGNSENEESGDSDDDESSDRTLSDVDAIERPWEKFQTRDIRVFISSTFLDMQSERDALVREVFPTVRRMAMQKGYMINLTEIDLRWGITSEESSHSLSVSICLNEVARCRPFFIGMLGGRYGYCPTGYAVDADDDVAKENFSWLKHAPVGMSVTELELRQAMESAQLQESNYPRLVFLRDNDYTLQTLPPVHRPLFAAENSTAAEGIKGLRASLKAMKGLRTVKYTAAYNEELPGGKPSLHMEDFKKKVQRELWKLVEATCPDDQEVDEDTAEVAKVVESGSPLTKGRGTATQSLEAEKENWEQHHFEVMNAKVFAGRKNFLHDVSTFVSGLSPASATSDNILTIVGGEGCGKSAIMGSIGQYIRKIQPGACIVSHYFGVGSGAAPAAAFRIASILVQKLMMEEEFNVTQDTDLLMQMLPAIYQSASKRARVIILIDGLDSCSTPDSLTALLSTLIPSNPPLNSRFIVSTRVSSPYLAALKGRKPPTSLLTIPDLALSERSELVRNHLRRFGKKLQESNTHGNQMFPLLKKSESSKPFYLLQVLTFLRLFSNFDTLTRDIRNLPSTSSQLHAETMKRLENAYGNDVCKEVLVALVLSDPLGGIQESDVYKLANVASTRRLLFALGDCLDWKHGSLKLNSHSLMFSIRKRYILKTSDELHFHGKLCDLYTSTVTPPSDLAVEPSSPSMFAPTQTNQAPVNLHHVRFEMLSARSLLCCLHHALAAKKFLIVETIASSVSCIEAIVQSGLLPYLLLTIADLQSVNRLSFRKIEPFAAFLTAHRHILIRHPSLTLQCALNMPPKSPIYLAAKSLAQVAPWVAWINPGEHGEKECVQTTLLTTQAVLCVAFDDRGEHMALGSKDWTCRVVKCVEGTVFMKLKHPNDVTAVVFQNAKTVVTGCEDGKVRVWSLLDGSMIQLGKYHTRRINDLSMHPKHISVMSASDDSTARVWSLQTTRYDLVCTKTIKAHKAPVSCCAIHSGGIVHATGAWDGKVHFLQNDRETFFDTKRNAVRSIAFIPSMVITVAIATYDGQIDLFDLASEQNTSTFNKHLGVPITRLAFSSDAKKMLSTDAAGRLKIWRAGVVGTVMGTLNGHHQAIAQACFHPTKPRMVISSSYDASVRHWETSEDEERIGALHASSVTGTAFAPNGSFVVSCSRDGSCHYMDLVEKHGVPEVRFTMAHPAGVTCLCVAQDSKSIFTGCIDGKVRAWRAEAGIGGRDGSLMYAVDFATPVAAVCQSQQDANEMMGVSVNGTVIRFAIDKGTVTSNEPYSPLNCGEPVCAYCTRNGEMVVGGQKGKLQRTKANRQMKVSKSESFQDWIMCCAASKDYLAVGTYDGMLSLASAVSQTIMASVTLLHDLKRDRPTSVNAVDFLSNDEVVVGCEDSTVRVYKQALPIGGAKGCKLKMSYIFHGSAPIRAIAACAHRPNQICAGDALGNVYYLSIRKPSTNVTQQMQQLEAEQFEIDAMGIETSGAAKGEHYMDVALVDNEDGDSENWSESDDDDDDESESYATTSASSLLDQNELLQRYALLYEEVPHGVKGQDRRQWYLRQKEVLKEAMWASKKCPVARMALRFRAQKAMQMFQTFQALSK